MLCLSMMVVGLGGCTAKLAPDYDRTLFSGIASANRDMQTLFASIGDGVDKATYPSRAASYTSLIGSLNALAIQASMRPAGDVTLTDVNKALAKVGIAAMPNDPNLADIPSARSLKDAAQAMRDMRDDDRGNGLRGGELKADENKAEFYVSQALAYEAFLKR